MGGAQGSLAQVLRRRRSASGLTQEELAERAGLSVRAISDLERGIHPRARRSTLERLADALRLSPVETAHLLRAGEGGGADSLPLPAFLRPRLGQSALVGRADARHRFNQVWERVRRGDRSALVYGGETGVGKSRLLGELAADPESRGCTVLGGRCDDVVATPYSALAEALRPWLRVDNLERVLAAVGEDAGHLALALPELLSRVDLPPEDADPGTSRTRLLGAMDALFAALTTPDLPLVLIVDDLHAADSSTLTVLDHLVRSSRPEPFLLIGAYRDTDVTAGHALSSFFGSLPRDRLERVELVGLDEAALDELVERSTGARPSPEILRVLHQQTGGNPFFVGEILRDLADQHLDLTEVLSRVPSGAREVVRARVRRLPAGARVTLETAAVIGDTVDPRVIELAVGPDAFGDLDEAARSGFVQPCDGGYAFRHGIVRTTLLSELNAANVAAIHWKVGEALVRLHAAEVDAHLTEIAHHLYRGARAGDPMLASEYLARVGRQQFRALALSEAVESLNAALTVAPADPNDDLRKMRILETLAETHFWRDDPDAMRAAALAAADLARRSGSPEDLARTVVVAARWNRGGKLEASVLERLDEAIARLRPGESAILSQVLAMRAYVLQGAARGFDSRTMAEEASAMARRSGDSESLALALLVQTYTEAGAPTLKRCRRIVADLEEAAARVPREDLRRQYGAMALRSRALAQIASGDRSGFAATRAELGAIAIDMRASFIRSQLLHWDAAVALAEGHFADAEERSREALSTWDARPDAMRVHLVQVASLALERGDHEHVLPEIERLVAGNRSSIGFAWRAVLAAGLAAVGRTDEARARYDELGANGFRGLAPDHQRPFVLRWLAEATALLGVPEGAEMLLPLLRPYSGQLLVGSGITTIEAAADRAIGQLLATTGEHDEAEYYYERAESLERALGFDALVLRTRAWSARHRLALARSAHLDAAHALASATADRAMELGMVHLATFAARGA